MIPIEDPNSVFSASSTELYAMLEVILEENTELRKQYTKELEAIEKGIELKIPILYIVEGWYEEYPTSQKVNIKSYGKCDIHKFYTEKRKRDNLMRILILENINQDEITQPRV